MPLIDGWGGVHGDAIETYLFMVVINDIGVC